MSKINKDFRQIALQYKEQLISNDLESNINAILLLKRRLFGNYDEEFVQMILDLDIHVLLLNHLTLSNYSINIHVLECVQQLCNYRIYYAFDYAARTAEIILKSLFHQENNFEVLKLALSIITSIIENLNNYYISKPLRYDRFLNTTNDLLLNQTNPITLSQAIDLFSTLLSYNQFQKHVGKNILGQVNLLWDKCLKTLPIIYESDVQLSILTTSSLCDCTLRFATELSLLHKHDKITAFLKDVAENSLKCLKFVCAPFIGENGLTTANKILPQFLLFLKTILQINIPKNELRSLCEYLVENNNFVVVADYLNASYNLVLPEKSQNKLREICLPILCEIMVKIEDENVHPYPIMEYKNYLYKHLEEVTKYNFKELLMLLSQESTTIDVKLCIIKYYSVYYVHSNQIYELNFQHINPFVTFLANIVGLYDIRINFVKDLWLLFAVLFSNINMKIDDYYLYRATRNLQKLILSHKNCLSKIITYHICVLRWLFWTPFTSKELKIAVMYLWLLRSQKNEVNFKQIMDIIKENTDVAFLLLQAVRDGSATISQLATNVLRVSLSEGSLKENNEFSQEISKAIMLPLREISKKSVVQKYVINSIYLLHLATCATTPVEPNLITYSVDVFTQCVGKLGMNEMLPNVFYTQAFEYVGGILSVAKAHQIQAAFSSFLNSKSMLDTLMCAVVSNEREISIRASKIFCSLLEFQNSVQVKTENKTNFKVNYLMQMLSISDEDRLQANFQIVKKLLITNQDYALNIVHPLTDQFLKGLYLRSLTLAWKPTNNNLSMYGLKMMISVLKYAYANNLPVLNYLCNHSGNHTLIIMYHDKQILRNNNCFFFKFVLCWLRFSQMNHERIYNRFSITNTFWKITLALLVNIFLNPKYDLNTNDLNLTFDILKELQHFDKLLPLPLKESLNDYFKMQRDGGDE